MLQIEAMELKIRLSGKYKTQAQIDGEFTMFTKLLSGLRIVKLHLWDGLDNVIECLTVTTSKLEHKNYILSDLKEEREERKENLQKIGMLLFSVCFPVMSSFFRSTINL